MLLNVDVKSTPDLSTLPEVQTVIESIERELGDSGRVLVRYSGTQQLCRVMVEAPTKDMTEGYCKRIADVVQKHLG